MSEYEEDISDAEEFGEALTELLERAVLNDIDVRGGWEVSTRVTNGNPDPDFTVEIYRLDG